MSGKSVIRQATADFFRHQGPNQASALAFCAMLSLIPLCFLAIVVAEYAAGGPGEVDAFLNRAVRSSFPWLQAFLDSRLETLLSLSKKLSIAGLAFIVWISGLFTAALQYDLALPYRRSGGKIGFWRLLFPWLTGPILGAALLCLLLFIQFLALASSTFTGDLLTGYVYLFSKLWAFFGLALFFLCFYVLLLPGRRALGAAIVLCLLLSAASHILTNLFSRLIVLPYYDTVFGPLVGVVLFMLWMDYNMALILWGGHYLRIHESRRRGTFKPKPAAVNVPEGRPRQYFGEEEEGL